MPPPQSSSLPLKWKPFAPKRRGRGDPGCTPIKCASRPSARPPLHDWAESPKRGPQFLQGWPHHKEGSWGEAQTPLCLIPSRALG